MDYTKAYRSAFPYFVETAPTGGPAVSLADVKIHLKLDPADTSQDSYLTLLVNVAAAYCEKYTRRTLLETQFKTYRDFFLNTIELRKSPYVSLQSFEYLVSSVLTTVTSTLYYITQEDDYSIIALQNDQTYLEDGDDVLQLIKIIFTAGYAANAAGLAAAQPMLYLAILNHIALLYENRGDCDLSSSDGIGVYLPNTARTLYDSIRILELV